MNNEYLIEERSRDIGDFLVGRLLPFRKKRQVGPFTFIDHMGPAEIKAGKYFDIDQHPHIGLSTLTYLIEGSVHHKDSTGADQIIEPGDVGFMTSGKGVTHTERTPHNCRTGEPFFMHGYQVWVAMPKDKEDMEPYFEYIKAESLPKCIQGGFEITLIAGEGFGLKSPLNVHSPLFMADVKTEKKSELRISDQLEGEIAIVVVEGIVKANENLITPGQMLISKTDNYCSVILDQNTRVLLFGGPPFEEERYLYWNFVSFDKERIEKAKEDWKNMKFPKVMGDDTYIPLP